MRIKSEQIIHHKLVLKDEIEDRYNLYQKAKKKRRR